MRSVRTSRVPDPRVAASAILWLCVYLALVLAPAVILLLGPTGPGLGFWWDLSAALGFSALAMMGVQSLLTARFRRATAPYGIDIIYYFHRYLAIVLLVILIAHPTLLIYDNPALISVLNPLSAPSHVAAGIVSLAAVLVLCATSIWRKTWRIAYEFWRRGHALLAFLAVALGLVHIEGVQYYTATPVMRLFWRLFLVSWLAVFLYVRIVRPWRVQRRPYRVIDVVEQGGDAWSLVLQPAEHSGMRFQAGQFAWLTLGSSPFRMTEHPFSFSSPPGLENGRVEFTIKALGDFTRTIGSTPRGAVAFVDGPYGAFTIDRHRAAPGFVFLAGGIGIAPIMSMLRALAIRRDRRPVVLVYACGRWERMTFREEIDSLRGELDLTVVQVLEEPPAHWAGEHGRITKDLLDRHLPVDRAGWHMFVCGPEAMRDAVERDLRDLGVALAHVHSELFDMV